MKSIEESTLGIAWIKYMSHIIKNGELLPDDRCEILETSPVFIQVDQVTQTDELIVKYGNKNTIKLYTDKMFSREIIPEFNATYGDRLFEMEGHNQIDWLVKKLHELWWVKSAAISLLKPDDHSLRIPCLTQLQPTIRKNRIILTAIFRSQNVFNSYANILGLKEIQKILASSLHIELGPIRTFITCPHIYSYDLQNAKKICKNEKKQLLTN